MHLARGLAPVWEVLKPKLTEHCVKSSHVKRQRTGITFSPIRCRALGRRRGAGAGEHARVEIKAYDMSRRSHLWCDQSRNHARAACDVERPLSRTKRGLRHEYRCPWPKDGGHELSLVHLWSIAAELPPLRLTHLRLLCGP